MGFWHECPSGNPRSTEFSSKLKDFIVFLTKILMFLGVSWILIFGMKRINCQKFLAKDNIVQWRATSILSYLTSKEYIFVANGMYLIYKQGLLLCLYISLQPLHPALYWFSRSILLNVQGNFCVNFIIMLQFIEHNWTLMFVSCESLI